MDRVTRRIEMSPAWLDALKPDAKTVEWRDSERDGLSLRVEPTGKRTWYARYSFNGRERRYKLGPYPALKLKAAREAASKIIGQASNGTDPQLERERLRIGETVSEAIEAWRSDSKLGPARWKGGIEGGTARSYLPHISALKRDLGARRVRELTPRDVERFVSIAEAPATRNRRLQAFRFLCAWATRKGLVDTDPSATLSKERETERMRILTDDELRALILGFDATRYGRAVRFLALTGIRRDEALGAKWEWLDRNAQVLTIPPESEKTGKLRGEPRRVPLSPAALTLLSEQREALLAEGLRSSPYIFGTSTGERPHADALKPILYRLRGRRSNGLPASNNKRAKKRAAVLSDGVTIHDIRRTVADALLNRLGVQPWIVDHVILGHARPKLLRTYMPTLPLGEARDALSKWADVLATITAPNRQEIDPAAQ